MGPTAVRVQQSSAGTFVLKAGGVVQSRPGTDEQGAGAAGDTRLMAGVFTVNEGEEDNIESTFGDYACSSSS
jgi:hypothetical protein